MAEAESKDSGSKKEEKEEEEEENATDAQGEKVRLDYDAETGKGELCVKIICLGDSAVGKSKLVDRFLIDGYKPQRLSTYALSLFRHRTTVNGEKVLVGQSVPPN